VAISADVRHLDLLTIAGYFDKKYGMTRPHLITKLILAAIGIHFLLHAMSSIISISATLNPNYPWKSIHQNIFFIILKLLFALTASLILLFRSDWLVRVIVGPNNNQCEKVSSRWIIAGFRMTACFCGLFIIYHRIDLLLYYTHAMSITTLEGQSPLFSTKIFVGTPVEIIKWLIGIYLVFGATHYTAWQMKAITAEQNKELKYE
jgi:hypothetical protein